MPYEQPWTELDWTWNTGNATVTPSFTDGLSWNLGTSTMTTTAIWVVDDPANRWFSVPSYVPSYGTPVHRYRHATFSTTTDRGRMRLGDAVEAVRGIRPSPTAETPAAVKAMRLLQCLLTDEQRGDLETKRCFYVRSNRGRRFCIWAAGQAGNVSWVDDDGRVLGRFCAHPFGLPDPDAWLAQALALQTDEDAFMAVANLHAGERPPPSPRERLVVR